MFEKPTSINLKTYMAYRKLKICSKSSHMAKTQLSQVQRRTGCKAKIRRLVRPLLSMIQA